ncbi:NF-X1-type zinc finger protein NFXL2 isoform X2 [Amborella trichopoda]|uniref:NF-X1-type zinc finger protein NFXL2 isoform X2 n=1 Tax=Amborella trichopoda TaxID=13333 RepID=UPI0009C01151|nr:NF-X1-type zinc finger protein NFXL2 isoform X2 [Amborella trichopoda]|eukprot:XP_020522415.1 NF-X1-type zinc finger protein NFXL2 isoform X2 [Amborella trichopoda]
MAFSTAHPLSSSSSSEDDDDSNYNGIRKPKLKASTMEDDPIFRPYLQIHGTSPSHSLSKIQAFLLASRSGALACLICLEKVRHSHPIWACKLGCYAIFHLPCIQNWARQSSNLVVERAMVRLSRDHFPEAAAFALENANWHCPKCRIEYPKILIPHTYVCYCGKLENPTPDPWIVSHSCGEFCNLPLKGNCGHECLLLCHPGPCPPCPRLIESPCFCGSNLEVRRCSAKDFSCNKPCSKLLACGLHQCQENCHNGSCTPCQKKGIHQCMCGKVKEERACSDKIFRCENPCGRELDCKKHVCSKGCHSGSCGVCELQGKMTCPCGNKEYKGIACDALVPSCGATCERMLNCGFHRCPERCHHGPCVDTCRIVMTKSCRCGSLRKQVPCYQSVVCERKCQIERDCGRHACKRRCCDGDCPPCSEICDRKLRCRNHKCPSRCHRGACAPCPLMVSISCFCGYTHFEVPCGTESEQKPPKCPKSCHITPLCRHASKCKPHKCHYGACPRCRLICEEQLPCGHNCQQRCHGPVPAPNPEFTLKPKKKKSIQQSCETPGSPCSPCQEIVLRQCLGQHIGTEQMMVCSNRTPFSCSNLCGNLLQCRNHYCQKSCHAIIDRSLILDGYAISNVTPESCEECTLPCQKERSPACPHPCPLPCHVKNCPPCKVLIKRSCHCGTMVHVFECALYNSMFEEEQQQARSCGGPCHRKLPNCTHLCPETCHPGKCPSPEKCSKKVTVRCVCLHLKKQWLCHDVQAACCNSKHDMREISRSQFGIGLLPCTSECDIACKKKTTNPEVHQRKITMMEDKAKPALLPKGRKRREHKQEIKRSSKLEKQVFQVITLTAQKWLLIATMVVLLLVFAYFGYHGLFWLSDWMNEVEARRLKNRYPRI